MTKITNKHLLPIYDKPMIYYPIQTLVDAGIRDILIVTGGKNAGDFLRLLANGKQFGLTHINYTYQEGEGGIADALALAEHFADGQKICVILGDNIIETQHSRGGGRVPVARRRRADSARKKLPMPNASAWPKLPATRSSGIEEKPKQPKSNYAVTGIYMYDATVFEKVRTLVPSSRGELEITDVNNAYIREGTMTTPGWRAGGPTPALSNRCCAPAIWWRSPKETAAQAEEAGKPESMKLLVTGGAGFIGSAFIRLALAAENPDTIVNLDKLTYAGNLENLESVANHPQYRFVRGDICDAKLVSALVAEEAPGCRRAFRGRIARGPQHLLAGAGVRNQPARHFYFARSGAAARHLRASSTSRQTRFTAASSRRTRPTRIIR